MHLTSSSSTKPTRLRCKLVQTALHWHQPWDIAVKIFNDSSRARSRGLPSGSVKCTNSIPVVHPQQREVIFSLDDVLFFSFYFFFFFSLKSSAVYPGPFRLFLIFVFACFSSSLCALLPLLGLYRLGILLWFSNFEFYCLPREKKTQSPQNFCEIIRDRIKGD